MWVIGQEGVMLQQADAQKWVQAYLRDVAGSLLDHN